MELELLNLLKKSLAAALLFPLTLFGITFEVDSFHAIIPYITSDTWLVCDLDNTLMESNRHLGSTHWGDHMITTLIKEGKTSLEAVQEARKIWTQIQAYIQVRPVQKEIPMHIKNLQQQVVVMGLTARDPREAQYTYEQLQSIQIDLMHAHPLDTHYHKIPLEQTLFDRGVLYCSDLHSKGFVFQTFLQELNTHLPLLKNSHSPNANFQVNGGVQLYPQRIVFVDDKWSHIHDVVQKLETIGIECIGIRLTCSDARVKAFHPKIADLQLKALPDILSDEEAYDLCRD